jgi:hypothetical protein
MSFLQDSDHRSDVTWMPASERVNKSREPPLRVIADVASDDPGSRRKGP